MVLVISAALGALLLALLVNRQQQSWLLAELRVRAAAAAAAAAPHPTPPHPTPPPPRGGRWACGLAPTLPVRNTMP
jgi:hypothetical protein